MTASFSLRLRLKVYSFICALRTSLRARSCCSDQLFWNMHSICSGIAICVGLQRFKCTLHTNGLGWPASPQTSCQPTTSDLPPSWAPGLKISQLRCDGLRIHADADAHRGRHGYLAQVHALAGRRLGLV